MSELTEKKKAGRKPMTEKEKELAAKKRAEEKAKAEAMVPSLVLQCEGEDIDVNALINAAKADFKAVKKRSLITEMKVYLKPEDRAMYYVINGSFDGKVEY